MAWGWYLFIPSVLSFIVAFALEGRVIFAQNAEYKSAYTKTLLMIGKVTGALWLVIWGLLIVIVILSAIVPWIFSVLGSLFFLGLAVLIVAGIVYLIKSLFSQAG